MDSKILHNTPIQNSLKDADKLCDTRPSLDIVKEILEVVNLILVVQALSRQHNSHVASAARSYIRFDTGVRHALVESYH